MQQSNVTFISICSNPVPPKRGVDANLKYLQEYYPYTRIVQSSYGYDIYFPNEVILTFEYCGTVYKKDISRQIREVFQYKRITNNRIEYIKNLILNGNLILDFNHQFNSIGIYQA